MNTSINWGIIGLGKIANTFAADLVLSKQATLQGVASRSIETAQQFQEKYNAVNAYGNYADLAKAEDIDVVYIATPHSFHFEHAMLCLENGKHVLCEKPMGLDAGQVSLLLQTAAEKNLFLMEGIWTRFIPSIAKVLELIDQNAIGEILFIKANFGFKPPVNLDQRIYNKALGGGSLLDIGIYPIYLSLLLLGTPSDIKAMARMTTTGVDSYCNILFDYPSQAKATLESTIEAVTSNQAIIYGTKGSILIDKSFHCSERIILTKNGTSTTLDIPYQGNGYTHEINEVHSCITNQKLESAKVPHKTSLSLALLLDRVKAEIGLKYNS